MSQPFVQKQFIPLWARTKHGLAFADIPTRLGGRFPDFCIIGAAKCGTTSLNDYLSQFPDIFMCPVKEPHYFSTPALIDRGDNWYTGLFAEARTNQICGEASTSYSRLPISRGTAERMQAANPHLKLIYIIRDPVKRAESDVLQLLKYMKRILLSDKTHRPLDEVFADLNNKLLADYCAVFETGCYSLQVEPFYNCFPADNILILTLGSLSNDLMGSLRRIRDFLGLPTINYISERTAKNVTADFITELDRERQVQRLRKIPLYNRIKRVLPEPIKLKVINLLSSFDKKNTRAFSVSLRDELASAYAPWNREMETRLGVSADRWEG